MYCIPENLVCELSFHASFTLLNDVLQFLYVSIHFGDEKSYKQMHKPYAVRSLFLRVFIRSYTCIMYIHISFALLIYVHAFGAQTTTTKSHIPFLNRYEPSEDCLQYSIPLYVIASIPTTDERQNIFFNMRKKPTK